MAGLSTEVFVADARDAQRIARAEDPSQQWRGELFKHLGDLELARLWTVLSGEGDEPKSLVGGILRHQESEEGPFVIEWPRPFVEVLAALKRERRAQVAEQWQCAPELSHWKVIELRKVLDRLAELAQAAVVDGKVLLQLVSL
jgi:hypothetical protein